MSIATLRAFFLGIYEFRRSFTFYFDDIDEQESYDSGRELAHRLTFRYWDQ